MGGRGLLPAGRRALVLGAGGGEEGPLRCLVRKGQSLDGVGGHGYRQQHDDSAEVFS